MTEHSLALERPYQSIDEQDCPSIPVQGQSKGPAELTDGAAVQRFLLAGNARMTLVSRSTGARFTFRVAKPQSARQSRAKDPERYAEAPWFVSVLTGPDNESDYQWLAMVFPDEQGGPARYVQPRKVRNLDAPSARASRWLWSRVIAGPTGIEDLLRQAEIWHEGRCGRCGRSLTVPESIALGLGPVCAEAE